MTKRIYVVTDHKGDERLVRAGSQAQAIHYVVNSKYAAAVAGPETLVRLLAKGQAVEDAK